MTALTDADRERLIALLGMCGSDHHGERANAALLAQRFLTQRSLTWRDVIARANGADPSRGYQQKKSEQRQERQKTRTWHDVVDECRVSDFAYRLSQWESGFLDTLEHWTGQPTPKQWEVLERVANKMDVPWPP